MVALISWGTHEKFDSVFFGHEQHGMPTREWQEEPICSSPNVPWRCMIGKALCANQAHALALQVVKKGVWSGHTRKGHDGTIPLGCPSRNGLPQVNGPLDNAPVTALGPGQSKPLEL